MYPIKHTYRSQHNWYSLPGRRSNIPVCCPNRDCLLYFSSLQRRLLHCAAVRRSCHRFSTVAMMLFAQAVNMNRMNCGKYITQKHDIRHEVFMFWNDEEFNINIYYVSKASQAAHTEEFKIRSNVTDFKWLFSFAPFEYNRRSLHSNRVFLVMHNYNLI